jgi:hypothetical protein
MAIEHTISQLVPVVEGMGSRRGELFEHGKTLRGGGE